MGGVGRGSAQEGVDSVTSAVTLIDDGKRARDGGRVMGTRNEAELLAKVTATVVDRELRKIGEGELALEALQAEMNAALDEVKAEFEGRIRPVRRQVDGLVARLKAGVRAERAALFEGDGQTLRLGFGKVAFKRQPDRVDPAEGVGETEVLRRMRKARKTQFYRLVPRLQKAELNKAASAGLLDAAALAGLGLVVVEGEESWRVTTDHAAVREAVGRG